MWAPPVSPSGVLGGLCWGARAVAGLEGVDEWPRRLSSAHPVKAILPGRGVWGRPSCRARCLVGEHGLQGGPEAVIEAWEHGLLLDGGASQRASNS